MSKIIRGEIVGNWLRIITEIATSQKITTITIITDGKNGDHSFTTVSGSVESMIAEREETKNNVIRRVHINLAGGVKLEVINSDRNHKDRFPCTLTFNQ